MGISCVSSLKPKAPVEPKPKSPIEPKPKASMEPKPKAPIEPKPKSNTDCWACTHLKVTNCSFVWTINNFSCSREETTESLMSPEFSAGSNDNQKWRIKLFPKGKAEESKEYVSLVLEPVPPYATREVRAKFIFSILNASKEKTNVSQCADFRKFTADSHWGYPKFIKRDTLFSKAGELLSDDKLTVRCELSIFSDPISISSQTSSIKVPGCHCSVEFGRLFKFQKFTDITLISGDGRQLAAHKAVLAARSPVFYRMFENEMQESLSGRVEITDIKYEVLQDMLNYIYTGEVPNMEKRPEDLLAAADKYVLKRLKIMCEDYIFRNLCILNAAEALILADVHDAKILRARVIDFIKLHAPDVIDSDGWQEMGKHHPSLAVEVVRALAAQLAFFVGPPRKSEKL